jgi:hypothetical protein
VAACIRRLPGQNSRLSLKARALLRSNYGLHERKPAPRVERNLGGESFRLPPRCGNHLNRIKNSNVGATISDVKGQIRTRRGAVAIEQLARKLLFPSKLEKLLSLLSLLKARLPNVMSAVNERQQFISGRCHCHIDVSGIIRPAVPVAANPISPQRGQAATLECPCGRDTSLPERSIWCRPECGWNSVARSPVTRGYRFRREGQLADR